MAACATALDSAAPASASTGAPAGFAILGGWRASRPIVGARRQIPIDPGTEDGLQSRQEANSHRIAQPGSTQPEQCTEPGTTAVEGSGTLEEWGMVQKQVTAQGWLMSTPEGDAPDPTLTRWGLAGCRQLAPQPSRSCHSRRSAC